MFERQAWMQRVGDYPRSDREYFGLLARAIFSAGLGPRVVAARWEGITEAFLGLDPETVGLMEEADVNRLLSNPAVIRNRRKIEAVIINARRFTEEVSRCGTFHAYLVELGADGDLGTAAELLAERFVHLGHTSAYLFLYSAGWRNRPAGDSLAEEKDLPLEKAG